jgi:hypothetical protein
MEIGRALGLTWMRVSEKLEKGECPMLLQFGGRKSHRRPYATYLGRDSVEHLKMWRQKWAEMTGHDPAGKELIFVGKRQTGTDAWWLDHEMKRTAIRLFKESLVQNGERSSWHTHAEREGIWNSSETRPTKSKPCRPGLC